MDLRVTLRTGSLHSVRWFGLALCALIAIPALSSSAVADTQLDERWHVVEIFGQKSGWMRTTEWKTDAGDYRTEMEMLFKLSRGGFEVEVGLNSESIESAEGELLRMEQTQTMGTMPITVTYEFSGDEVLVRTSQMGSTTESVQPMPGGEWYTPRAAAARIERHLADGDTQFELSTLEPMIGLTPVKIRYEVIGEETVEALGKIVPAIKWRTEADFMPGTESYEYVSLEGEAIRTEVNLGGITAVVLLSEKEVALSEMQPAEIMASTLVKPDRPIRNPRGVRKAEYLLSIAQGKMPRIIETGSQIVQQRGKLQAKVLVDIDLHAPAPRDEVNDPAFREASWMINSDDPEIQSLTAKATANAGPDAADRAEAMRRFVSRYVNTKGLGVGYATASEVCRTRAGDCTEHGVLLAAMLRADGIPSRVVSGLIYVDSFLGSDDVFGYHMWTQALLEVNGRSTWVDLDATLGDSTPYDAAHIAISTSRMAEGDSVNSMVSLAPLMGQLEVHVASTQ